MTDLSRYHGGKNAVAPDGYRARSHWLRGLTAAQISEGIEAIPAERFEAMIQNRFPTKPTQATSVAEALAEAGADFRVERAPYFFGSRDGKSAIESTRAAAIVRGDTGAEIGHATPDCYGVVQTADTFAGAQYLVDRGEMAMNAIEVLNDGSRIRLTGLIGTSVVNQIGRPEADGPDVLAHFLQFVADHSGKGSNAANLVTLRLDCFNGITSKVHSKGFLVPHRANAEERMAEATAALLNVKEKAIAETMLLQRLASFAMTPESFRDFAVELMDDVRGELAEDATARVIKSRDKAIGELEKLFVDGSGTYGASGYDGYMSVTEWLTPRREQFEDAAKFARKFESSVNGHTADVKTKALKRLTKLVS